MNRNEAREHSLAYIGVKVIAFGTTADELRHRKPEGFASPVEPGYDLAYGKITVPCGTKDKPHHTFKTDDLVAEVSRGQLDLFAEA